MKPPLVIHWVVQGLPRAQPRPRITWRGRRPHAWTPPAAQAWKQQITLEARRHLPPREMRGRAAVSLWTHFWFERPNSHYRAGNRLRDSAPSGHVQRPDLDNLLKAVMDALTAAGAWRDDAQVVRVEASKSWAGDGRAAGCEITLHYHSNPPDE